MLRQSIQMRSLFVIALGAIAHLSIPQRLAANPAYINDGSCAMSCPTGEDLCKGGNCAWEVCYTNNNVEMPYVVRCPLDS